MMRGRLRTLAVAGTVALAAAALYVATGPLPETPPGEAEETRTIRAPRKRGRTVDLETGREVAPRDMFPDQDNWWLTYIEGCLHVGAETSLRRIAESPEGLRMRADAARRRAELEAALDRRAAAAAGR